MSKDGLFNKPPSSDSFWNKNALSYAQQERDDLQEINVDESPKYPKSKRMSCYNCDTDLIWGGDHDIEEEFDHPDAHSMVTNLSCPKCGTFVEVYTPKSFFEIFEEETDEDKFRKDGMYK